MEKSAEGRSLISRDLTGKEETRHPGCLQAREEVWDQSDQAAHVQVLPMHVL